MSNNDRIQEIKDGLYEIEHNGYVGGDVYYEDVVYLLSQVDFWKQAAETQKNNNLAILKEHRAMKEALEGRK